MNPVNFTNVTNIGQFGQVANANGGGFTFLALQFMFFVIAIISLVGSVGVEASIMISAFGAIVLGLIGVGLGWIQGGYGIGAYVGIELVMFAYAWWASNKT